MELPYTTTLDQRDGPGPPYSNMTIEVNLFFRVFLGIMANLCCWVPMRILWKNGELAASVLCVCTMLLNFYNVINALIWRNDDVQTWFTGYGWCDLQIYTVFPIETLYAACFFGIMRNMATRVGMMRVTNLNSSEKRRRNLREALVVFPVPLLQLVLTYFVLAQRFNVSTLVGCTNSYHKSWPYLVFFNMPTPIFTILAVYFSILTWIRFRQVEKTTSVARHTSSMTQRHQRMRRKLYLLALCIMVPFFPLQMLFLYSNIMNGLRMLQPYDFKKIHSGAFNQIDFTVYDQTPFVEMNHNYIAILTVIPIFWFFGFTKEAVNTYRGYLLALGLGKWFPKLHDEYDPDRTSTGASRSWSAQLGSFLKSKSPSFGGRKHSVLPTVEHVSQSSTVTSQSTTDTDVIKPAGQPAQTSPPNNPWPDVPANTVPNQASDAINPTPHRNPFLFRTMLGTPFPTLPFFRRSEPTTPAQVALTDYQPSTRSHPRPGLDTNELMRPITAESNAQQVWASGDMPVAKVRTRVWSDDDGRQQRHAEAGKGSGEAGDSGLAAVGGPGEGGGVRVETRIERRESP